MAEYKRDFKGVWIPKQTWLDDRLSALEKVILTEIDSLDCEETGCTASNEYLAGFCQCSVPTLSRALSKLSELGYIWTEAFNGRMRVMHAIVIRQPNQNDKADISKRLGTEKTILFNINNNKDYYNNVGKPQKNFVKPTLDEISEYCKERKNSVDANKFFDFYESKGWFVGKNKMKDWKAAVRTWEKPKQGQAEYKEFWEA